MAKCKYKGQFGKLVIGKDAAEEEQVAVTEGRDIFGKNVLGKHPSAANEPGPEHPASADPPEVAEAVAVEADESLSVRAVKVALKESSAPAVLDRFARAEFLRPEGARKSVLELLLSKERGREDPAPRDEAVAALESKLAELAEE